MATTSFIDEATLKRIGVWLKDRSPEHATTECAAMMREFGVTPGMARAIRALTGRDVFTECGCCEAVGDHGCGDPCSRCDGTGRNPTEVPCTLPHGLNCTCSWAGE